MELLEFCAAMRGLNVQQRKIVIHYLLSQNPCPIQIFFTSPAESGKTTVLRLIMESNIPFTDDGAVGKLNDIQGIWLEFSDSPNR